MTHEAITQIPKDRTVTYARTVVDYRPQKADPNMVRITAGGNLIDYPHKLTTHTAYLTTTKIMWNIILSTEGSKYMCIDINNMYLATPLDIFEYMQILFEFIPTEFTTLYNLSSKVNNEYVYMKIEKGMYRLPHAGILAKKLLRKRLEPHGYYEMPHTSSLWRHIH